MALAAASLGEGSNEAVIYERGGTRRLFTLPAVEQLDWGRALDGISRATITCTPAAAADGGLTWRGADCAGLLSSINPWAHEVVIYRNGSRVWEGPVLRPAQKRGAVTIQASDVLGWTEARAVHTPVLADGVSVRDQADALLTAAMTADDPNVLAHVLVAGDDAVLTSIDLKAAPARTPQRCRAWSTPGSTTPWWAAG